DVEKILNRIPVIRVEMPALLEHRPDPKRGDAESLQVIELRADALRRPALPAIAPALCPAIEPETRGPRPRQISPVNQRPPRLLPVAKSIGQKKVEDFIAPVRRRRKEPLAARQRHITRRSRPRLA